MKRIALVLMTALLVAGCAGKQTQTGLVTSGEALIGVGNTFVAVGASYQANCLPAPRDPKLAGFCAGFRSFAPKFQQSYPPAVDAWKIARSGNDASKAQEATAVVLQLSTELTALAMQIMAAQGVK